VKCRPRQYETRAWVETSVNVTSNIYAQYHRNHFISAQQLSPKTLLVWETLKAKPYRTGGCPLERHSCLCRWSIVSVRTYRVREQGGRENELFGGNKRNLLFWNAMGLVQRATRAEEPTSRCCIDPLRVMPCLIRSKSKETVSPLWLGPNQGVSKYC